MSDFTVLGAVSVTLRALLETHITLSGDPQLSGIPVDLRSPKEMRDDNNAVGISLWLYRVTRNGFTSNLPPPRPGLNQQARNPLPLDLFYLATPVLRDPRLRQVALGRVLQVLNDHSLLRGADLQDSLRNTSQELRVTFEMAPLEELTRVWSALLEQYQLCVSYHVQVVNLEAHHEPLQVSPVLLRETTYAQILETNSELA